MNLQPVLKQVRRLEENEGTSHQIVFIFYFLFGVTMLAKNASFWLLYFVTYYHNKIPWMTMFFSLPKGKKLTQNWRHKILHF